MQQHTLALVCLISIGKVLSWQICGFCVLVLNLPLIDKIAPQLKTGDIVVSFAAAIPLSILEARLPEQVSVVRIMPNMP